MSAKILYVSILVLDSTILSIVLILYLGSVPYNKRAFSERHSVNKFFTETLFLGGNLS